MSEVLPQALVEESKFRLRIYLEVQLVHPSSFKFQKFIRLGLVVFMWARTGVCCPECMITELPGSISTLACPEDSGSYFLKAAASSTRNLNA